MKKIPGNLMKYVKRPLTGEICHVKIIGKSWGGMTTP